MFRSPRSVHAWSNLKTDRAVTQPPACLATTRTVSTTCNDPGCRHQRRHSEYRRVMLCLIPTLFQSRGVCRKLDVITSIQIWD